MIDSGYGEKSAPLQIYTTTDFHKRPLSLFKRAFGCIIAPGKDILDRHVVLNCSDNLLILHEEMPFACRIIDPYMHKTLHAEMRLI